MTEAVYNIVLTQAPAPGEIVTVDLTPQITRTLDSKLRFDASANNGQTSGYQIVMLNNDPLHPTLNIGDPVLDVDGNPAPILVTFDDGNWFTEQTIRIVALEDKVAEGGDVIVVPALEDNLSTLRGPISIDAGVAVNDALRIDNPFMLPEETNVQLKDGVVTAAGVDSEGRATLDRPECGNTSIPPRPIRCSRSRASIRASTHRPTNSPF